MCSINKTAVRGPQDDIHNKDSVRSDGLQQYFVTLVLYLFHNEEQASNGQLWAGAPPFTSARVLNRFEFVEFGGDMCSNCQGMFQRALVLQGGTSSFPHYICTKIFGT